ncbi:MAG TPA: SDR family NAD(P)-dependent oxidoreductase [Burkholderiaceae bacterium]|nr:SDR family NAD(P)-dependent oxidoreductase [Burkholderiaceae bacterium]
MLHRVWRSMKAWRRLPLGPVSLIFRLDRRVRITNGSIRSHAYSSQNAHPIVEAIAYPSHSDREAQPLLPSQRCAVIVGVGPGFGHALARRLSRDGFDLVLVSRDAQKLQPLVDELHSGGVNVESCGIDATDEVAVSRLFERISVRHGIPALVVYSVQWFGRGQATEIEVSAFETAWRHNCLGAFHVSRAAARHMLPRGSGTIVLVGSTSSLLGRAGHLNLAVGKFGQRALAQVLARELWPQGIHVAHAVIDADIREEPGGDTDAVQADPSHVADSILALHKQPKTAWTSELDLRPWNEAFWEHC